MKTIPSFFLRLLIKIVTCKKTSIKDIRKRNRRIVMSRYIVLLGRLLFSAIFIIKSLGHFSPKMIQFAAESGVPLAAVTVPLAGIFALLGGLSILFGYKAKIGAWLLVIFLLGTAFTMHRFWEATESFAMLQGLCFWKNISMLGAVLLITQFGTGPCSLDKR